MSWTDTLSIAGLGTLLSLLTSVGSSAIGTRGTVSLAPAVQAAITDTYVGRFERRTPREDTPA